MFCTGWLLIQIEPSIFMAEFSSQAAVQPHLRPPQTNCPEQVLGVPGQQFWPAPPQVHIPLLQDRPVEQEVPPQQGSLAAPQVHMLLPESQVRLGPQGVEPLQQTVADTPHAVHDPLTHW
jgi:hypothetical protein